MIASASVCKRSCECGGGLLLGHACIVIVKWALSLPVSPVSATLWSLVQSYPISRTMHHQTTPAPFCSSCASPHPPLRTEHGCSETDVAYYDTEAPLSRSALAQFAIYCCGPESRARKSTPFTACLRASPSSLLHHGMSPCMKAPSFPRGRNLFPEELKLWKGSFGMVSAGVMAAIGGRTESMYLLS